MRIKEAFRALWYYCFVGGWHSRIAYMADFVTDMLSVLLDIVSTFFLASSIAYQSGIREYGAGSPLGFMLSGILLSRLLNPFRFRFPLSVKQFYYSYSRPISPWLTLLREWLSVSIWYSSIQIITCTILIASTQELNVRLEAALAFILVSILMTMGLNFLENGIIYIVKQETAIRIIRTDVHLLLSGESFPVTVLPEILQYVARFYPPSWAYKVWRKIVFVAMSVTDLEFAVFLVLSFLILLLGLAVFRMGYNKICREGLVL